MDCDCCEEEAMCEYKVGSIICYVCYECYEILSMESPIEEIEFELTISE